MQSCIGVVRPLETPGAVSPELLCREAEITHAFGFSEFGLSIVFPEATEVTCHDGEMVLDPDLKSLVARYGVVVIRNAFLNAPARAQGHRNVFPHLDFHRDRNPSHENKYTLFSRDPFDAIQRVPRWASTLFIDNAVGYLQALKEGLLSVGEKGRRSRYKIFSNDDASGMFGSVILEQPRSAPEGVGEIAIIDNNRILHANFRHEIHTRPYSICARYLF